jgi:PAS domain S-box-containing protein
MRPLRSLPFKAKLILVMTLASVASVALASAILFVYESRRYRSDEGEDLAAQADIIAANSVAALAFGDSRAAGENLASLRFQSYISAAALYDRQGALFAAYQRSAEPGFVPETVPSTDRVATEGSDMVVVRTVERDGQPDGTVFIRADASYVRSRVLSYGAMVALVFLLSIGAALGLSSQLQKVVSRPVLELTAAAVAVSQRQDYSIRVSSQAADELGHLSQAFNAMLGTIEGQNAALRAARDELESRVEARVRELRREMTQREQAQQALDASEARYRAIVDTTNEWIWSADVHGTPLYNNPAVERILGYAPDDLPGRSYLELLDAEERPRFERMLEEFAATRTGWSDIVVRLRHRDGGWRTIESSGTPILDASGAVVGFHGVNRDITQRVTLEDQLRHAQKMEAVGRLAGGVAHDFNNLLNVIMGYAALLSRRVAAGADASRLAQIVKSAERAAGLTRQLLAFSRKQVLEPVVLDLNAVVGELGGMLRRLIGEDVELVLQPAAGLWPVKADPGQLEQVVMNLAVNARDAMPHGGALTITTANVEVTPAEARQQATVPAGRYVVLTVRDNGCGMDQETQSHIFEPFFSTKEKGKGTGLGLATVYGVVQQTGGSIHVESAPGRGAAFHIYLPPSEGALAPAPPALAPELRHGAETVLLVEDEDSLRELTAELLEGLGYRVLAAGNGADALRSAQGHRGAIDLLLTDVVMPGISGREVAARLQQARPGVRVLFMSGYTDDAIAQHGVLEPGVRLLNKPFKMDQLAHAVAQALGRERPAGQDGSVDLPACG